MEMKTQMNTNVVSVRLEVKSSGVARSLKEVIESIEGFRFQASSERAVSDLMIFELGDNPERDFKLLRSLLELEASTDVFLTSPHSDAAVLRGAFEIGARDFLHQPIDSSEIRKSLERYKRQREKPLDGQCRQKGRIINVVGSKGGVGTTTLAVNLAVLLAENKDVHSVALMDLKRLFGEIPFFLEIKPKYHLGEITRNIDRLDATFLMNILCEHPTGVYVLPSPASLNGTEANSPEIMGRLLSLMEGMFEFVVIDAGQSLDATSLKTIEMSEILLLVSILSLPCLSNAHHLLKSLVQLGYVQEDRVRVVLNRYIKKSDISLSDAEEAINKEVFWMIPNDYRTSVAAINQGKALSEIAPKARITKKMRELADALVRGENEVRTKRRRFWKKR